MLCCVSVAGVNQPGADTTVEGVATTENQGAGITALIVQPSSGFLRRRKPRGRDAPPEIKSGKHFGKSYLICYKTDLLILFSVAVSINFKVKDLDFQSAC